jgi:S-adenosyl-L-methionine hydrolase (adenosine-forming)
VVSAVAGPVITLTTDFGEDSPYVAAVKGVLLGVNPDARLLDLSHQIPPQDLRHAAFFLASALPYFPPGVVHVVVVDPGVGTERAVLYVEVGGHRLLVPDNGCWTLLASRVGASPVVRRVTEPRWWPPSVSATFHGRDVFAPVAAHLSRGIDPGELGPVTTDWVRLALAEPRRTPEGWAGEVVFVDHFGNLITNVPGELVGRRRSVRVGDAEVTRWVRTYAEAEAGAAVALVSSNGFVEVAVVQGSAARRFGVQAGVAVLVNTVGA